MNLAGASEHSTSTVSSSSTTTIMRPTLPIERDLSGEAVARILDLRPIQRCGIKSLHLREGTLSPGFFSLLRLRPYRAKAEVVGTGVRFAFAATARHVAFAVLIGAEVRTAFVHALFRPWL